MFFEILNFVLQVGVTLVGGACLLRVYLLWHRMGLGAPLDRFVQAVSQWLVGPLGRVVPSAGRLHTAGLLAAWLLKLLQYAAILGLLGLPRWGMLPVLALLGVVKLAASVLTAILIVWVVASWTQPYAPMTAVFQRLAAPLMAPLRRFRLTVGGVDLAPLVLGMLLQVLTMAMNALQVQLLGIPVLP